MKIPSECRLRASHLSERRARLDNDVLPTTAIVVCILKCFAISRQRHSTTETPSRLAGSTTSLFQVNAANFHSACSDCLPTLSLTNRSTGSMRFARVHPTHVIPRTGNAFLCASNLLFELVREAIDSLSDMTSFPWSNAAPKAVAVNMSRLHALDFSLALFFPLFFFIFCSAAPRGWDVGGDSRLTFYTHRLRTGTRTPGRTVPSPWRL